MTCETPGCPHHQAWEVTTADGWIRRICQHCYETEGWNRPGAGGKAVPIEGIDRPELIKQGRKWHYTTEAVQELNRLHEECGTWQLVADRLSLSISDINNYLHRLREKGFEVESGRRRGGAPKVSETSRRKVMSRGAQASLNDASAAKVVVEITCPHCKRHLRTTLSSSKVVGIHAD